MSEILKVGLLGYGTIGSGVIRMLTEPEFGLADRIKLVKVADTDLKREREVSVDPALLTDDTDSVVNDPDIDVIVELIGGVGVAKKYVEMALDAGKDVVTANKYMIALHGDELHERAVRNGARLLFEASVAGGVPIIQVIREQLAIDRVLSINAILNGTCNYILTRMEQVPGMDSDQAVAEAQQKGFAEADPTLDVSGMDTAQKLCILLRKAFRTPVLPEQIDLQGITGIGNVDVQSALEMGYRIKLVAHSHRVNGNLEIWVGPALIPKTGSLAQVSNEFNAVAINCEAHGEQLFTGKGAGMMPTAGAVVGDLFSLLNHEKVPSLLSETRLDLPVVDRKDVRCRYFARFTVKDQPGVIAAVSSELASRGISIASVVQHENKIDPERGVPLVVITYETTVGAMAEAVAAIDRHDIMMQPAHTIRIMDSL
jgi:homoserine dehydrogenase